MLKSGIEQGFFRIGIPKPNFKPSIIPDSFEIKKAVKTVSLYKVEDTFPPFDPTRDAHGQRYFEDSFITNPDEYKDVYECFRFYVPWGRIGIARQCWQWLEIKDAVSVVLPTPFDAMAHFRTTNFIDILWRLRFVSGEVNGPRRYGDSNWISSGYGFPELPNFDYIRFPWGSNAPVFWRIPENTTLMMFCDIKQGKDDVVRFGGRIAGYTQPISDASQHNTRYGWQW